MGSPDFGAELEDPFAGLLGQTSPREDLWLGKPAPRYTSYPPATAFRDDIAPESYSRALSAIAPEEPVSLYLHVPFCKSICLYCGCHTCPTQNHDKVTNYLGSIHRELEHVANTAPRSRRISRIHFGGGSPNIMSEKDMGLMMGALARRFDLSGCDEVAMELDPRLITKAQARTLALLGITRVSLGVQDFVPEVQEAIGRIQSYEMITEACAMLREAGIEKINFDLMYGLPFQSPVSIAETARKAVKLKPDRIALFSYAHVPQVKKHQRALEQYVLPGPALSLALENAARTVLREAAYVEIGIDHFARAHDPLAKAAFAGKIRRNFQGYTDDNAAHILGVGASSIGRAYGNFYQNARDIDDYQQRVSEHNFATTRGLRLTGEDRLRAAIIESLMCTMSVNYETLCHDHHFSPATLAASLEALKPYEEAGIITRKSGRITLSTRHRMAVRVIAACFDKTVRAPDAPVSKAV
jgi:oxygen-independent coproporphyrinogen-3 oxidase